MSSDDIRVGPLATWQAAGDAENPEPRVVVSKRKGGPGQPQYRFRLINWARALVGDRLVIHLRDGIAGLVIRGCAAHRAGDRYVAYLDGARKFKVQVKGKPRARLERTIAEPEIPEMPAVSDGLLGPMEPQQFVPGGRKVHPLDAYFVALDELVINAGCNFMSICPIAYWSDEAAGPGGMGSPWLVRGGRFDLASWDPLFWRAMRCLLWRAARAGIAVHLYPFEFISFNHGYMWEGRAPLYAGNNQQGWFAQTTPKGYKGFHTAIKLREPRQAFELLTAYFGRCAQLLDPRHHHALVPVIEGQSRSVDHVLAGYRRGRPLGVNLKSLYQDSAWPEMEGHLRSDLTWRELLRWAGFAAIHSCDTGGVIARMVGRLLPYAEELDFAVLSSTDGAGSGCGELSRYRRPQGTRPNVDDLVAIWAESKAAAGGRHLGLEIKVMSWEDALATLPEVTARIEI